ncbi:MAG: Gfo/Idh/MocA family oxidoreductase [Pseudorhodoplanes sp.]|nr:MAG: Gfo/Idh/MocA family oxidoreductase [Pseudorhodoplanes sp.]
MTDTLGFALVGCGRIAEKYSQIFANGSLAGARLVACCDVQEERARAVGERHAVPHYADFRRMLEHHDKEIDVVCILTQSGLHEEHAVALAPYRKHLVVEKPMALTLEGADRMIAAADAAGIKLFVVKQNRYNLAVQQLRRALDAGRFGKLVMGSVRVRWCRRQDYYDQDDWRGTWAYDGGVFSNQASHHIDLLEWCLGEPVSVVAKSRTALVDIEAEDTGVAIVSFRNGTLGVIEATTATRPRDLEGSISILGEKGTVEIGGFAVNSIKTWAFAEPHPDDKEIMERYSENPPNVYGFSHVRYLENVVDAIRNDAPSLVDGLEGRKSLELIIAIYESIVGNREVALRFRAQKAPLGLRRP